MELEIGERAMLLVASSMVVLFKLVVIFIAYKIIKLGYDLLLRGVKGEFEFSSNINGVQADIRSASPGLLFILLGCMIIIVAVTEKFPQELETKKEEHILFEGNIEKPYIDESDRSLD